MSQGGSLQSFWTLINDYQLYQMLLLLGVYIPDELVDFFTSFSFSTFSFSFLDPLIPFNLNKVFSDFAIGEVNAMYIKVGINYSSTFLNEIFLILVLLLIVVSDIIMFPFIRC